MKRLCSIALLICSTLTACNQDNTELTPLTEQEKAVEAREIDDDNPIDIDQTGEETEPGARVAAATGSTTYFQLKSDDGEKFVKAFEVEDYFFGSTQPSGFEQVSPTNLKGSKYKLLTWKGAQYVKSRSLKYGWHLIRYKVQGTSRNDIQLLVEIMPNVKGCAQGNLYGDIDFWVGTKLVRFAWDATIPAKSGTFSAVIKSNASNQTFAQFYTANNEQAASCDDNGEWFFDAEPEGAGKSCAVRLDVAGLGTEKYLMWSSTPSTIVGKSFDLASKKGMSLKFKLPKVKKTK